MEGVGPLNRRCTDIRDKVFQWVMRPCDIIWSFSKPRNGGGGGVVSHVVPEDGILSDRGHTCPLSET